ncbi:MAG: L-seryl-tRNA(Sec) selenium transferase [Candidatus Eremiobacteraeota bacterium]|nr:L-seryl-tRNA(Sec) selenium transferase [Candidatus Eremiobacteraeota bacterium]
MKMDKKEQLRSLPSIDFMLSQSSIQSIINKYPRRDVVDSLRESIEIERNGILKGNESGDARDVVKRVVEKTSSLTAEKNNKSLKRVINATGVIVHTNLGRAILPEKAIELMLQVSRHYSNLEFDLDKGKRSNRNVHLKRHLIELTGAEDTLVVNNNAAAVLLMLDTFANGKEVIVSRGELIEIGGSFRLPDILRKGGAKLVEVGCTNKTYISDYENAITENTAILMKSHKSNYAIRGFFHEASGEEVAALAKKYNLISADDMGSGLLLDLSRYGLRGEQTAGDLVKSGMDIVTFSGDKMLGGPQAGIILGRKNLIQQMKSNPLARALRPGKTTISALEGTLLLYRDPENIENEIPILKMLAQSEERIKERTSALLKRMENEASNNVSFGLVKDVSRTGGGAFPDTDIPTFLLTVSHKKYSADELHKRLLGADIPILGRIHNATLSLDLRTVLPEEEEELARQILAHTE